MNIFKNSNDEATNLISTDCPNCGAKLENDIVQGKSVCPYCGSQFIIDKKNSGAVDSVLAFVERQQLRHKEYKIRKQKLKEAKKQEQKEKMKKHWWIYALIVVAIVTTVVILIVK